MILFPQQLEPLPYPNFNVLFFSRHLPDLQTVLKKRMEKNETASLFVRLPMLLLMRL